MLIVCRLKPARPVVEALDLDPRTRFREGAPVKIIEWAVPSLTATWRMTSSFGAEAMVTIHLATRAKPDIRIILSTPASSSRDAHRFLEQMRQRST